MGDVNLEDLKNMLQDFESKKTFQTPPSIKRANDEDLNEVLLKVQNDITLIRKDVLSTLHNSIPTDYDKVKLLFEQVERNIQEKRDNIIFQFNNRPAILAAASVFKEVQLRDGVINQPSDERPNLVRSGQELTSPGYEADTSYGQKFLALQKLKTIINPSRLGARLLLSKHYGVPLPHKENAVKEIFKSNRPVTGSTVLHPNIVCAANRMNGRITPPPATTNDVRKGVLNLIERKLIPAASQLSIKPSPIKQKKVILHPLVNMRQYKLDLAMSRKPHDLALVKFDESELTNAHDLRYKHSSEITGTDRYVTKESQKLSHEDMVPMPSSDTHVSFLEHTADYEANRMIAPSIDSPHYPSHKLSPLNDSLHHHPSYRLFIQNGVLRVSSQDFLHFKGHYCLSWGCISAFLQKVEKLMVDYSVPIAFVDGDRLADLALFFEVGPKPTIKDLLKCVLNSEDVETIIRIPGRRYMALDGLNTAAITIQSVWRCHSKHSAYLEYRRRKWAAGIIALTWIMKCKMTMIRQVLKENHVIYLQNFRRRMQILQSDWKKIKQSKRVIIHIPSLGYTTDIRDNLNNIATLQNNQIGRICDIIDPNVEVIYVCPVFMKDDMLEYYMKLLNLISNLSGQDYNALKDRLKIFTPDFVDKFPEHNLPLSTLLKYSTRSLCRIKSLIKGKQAYIVPGVMNVDDLFIADELDIPIMGTEPDLTQLYSMKSGVRRIFESANVSYAPGEYDIYSMQQVYTSLARLVTENLHVTRWLFKMDDQIDGRGTGYCEITPYLTCFEFAMKEQERYGEKWKKKWAHESVYNAILSELPNILGKFATPVNKNIYSTWDDFITKFLAQGGIIEASPPSDSITSLTANVLIEPDGCIQILSVADQIHSTSPYNCWGYTVPQTSIDPIVINSAIMSITSACKNRGILGYCSIDYVTFINPLTNSQELWAVGLGVSYSSSYSLLRLMTVLTNGHLDVTKNTFEVTIDRSAPKRSAYKSKRKKSVDIKPQIRERGQRFCALSTNLHHTNLNNIHYNVFFQLCKAHGIGYDEKLKVGTVFTLVDHIQRETMGMMFIGETLMRTLSSFALNLTVIHSDISSPSMQGQSNFHGAIQDVKQISKALEVNMSINQQNIPTDNPLNNNRQIQSAIISTPAENNRLLYRSHSAVCRTSYRPENHTSSVHKNVPKPSSSLSVNSDPLDHRFPSSPVSIAGEKEQEESTVEW